MAVLSGTYEARQIDRVIEAGPCAGEDWFRLQVSGILVSHQMNVSADQLHRIALILSESDHQNQVHQCRERAVRCFRCHTMTWNLNALCDAHRDAV
jgi:hypothetical protein